MSERDVTVCMAKLAEQSERFDEMADYMKQLVDLVDEPLTVEERNLLSVAFKNAVGARRASLRIIISLEQKQKQRNQAEYVALTESYHKKVVAELEEICQSIIGFLEKRLIERVQHDTEACVFYWKMKGDYYRYLCEFSTSKEDNKKLAQDAYAEACTLASTGNNLATTHPVRLGLALNQSVFFYEILGNPEKACNIAREAFDQAISHLEHVDEESYRDSTLIMQLLRDNLTLWTDSESNAVGAAEAAPQAVEQK